MIELRQRAEPIPYTGLGMVNYGASSEHGPLRVALLRRPGREIETTSAPRDVLWRERLDATHARLEHDSLVFLLESFAVRVQLLEGDTELSNLYFCRDPFVMTPSGAILAQMATPVRAAETLIARRELRRLNIPLIDVDAGPDATWEGGDVMIVNPSLAFVALSQRTNQEGADKLRRVLKRAGIGEVIVSRIPSSVLHLDCCMSIAGPRQALVWQRAVPAEFVDALRRHGFQLACVDEADAVPPQFAVNTLCLRPGVVVLPAGCLGTRRALGALGVFSVECDVAELTKGDGGIHCMVGVLARN
jgi:arginine deiminase